MGKITEEERQQCANAETSAKAILKKGDRVGTTKCPGTKRVITFDHWDGCWMVSKTGIDDYHPINIYSINGKPFDIKKQVSKTNVTTQIGCGYCKYQTACLDHNPKINKAKLGCEKFVHHEF